MQDVAKRRRAFPLRECAGVLGPEPAQAPGGVEHVQAANGGLVQGTCAAVVEVRNGAQSAGVILDLRQWGCRRALPGADGQSGLCGGSALEMLEGARQPLQDQLVAGL